MTPDQRKQLPRVVDGLRKSGKPTSANAVQAAIDRIAELEAKSHKDGVIGDIMDKLFGGKE